MVVIRSVSSMVLLLSSCLLACRSETQDQSTIPFKVTSACPSGSGKETSR